MERISMRGTTLEVQSFKVIQEMVHNEQEATGSAVQIRRRSSDGREVHAWKCQRYRCTGAAKSDIHRVKITT